MNVFHPSEIAALLSSEFCVRLTQSLLHFLWQGLAVALVVWVLDRALSRASPRWRYAVGVAALLMMLSCVPATYFVLGNSQGNIQTAAAPAVAEAAQSDAAVDSITPALPVAASVANVRPVDDVTVADRPSDWSWQSLLSIPVWLAPYATLGYLLGVAIMLARLAVALWSGHRLRTFATPLADPAILAMVARQAGRIGLKVAPAIAWCQRAAVPLVVGIVRPMILLPTAIASGLAPDQLEALLAHELAHLKRLDLIVNLVQRLAESLLFFHPAVWYVSRRISIERENCCDDCVLAAGWGRVEYADALVRMAEVCAAVRGLAGLEGAALLAASGESPSQFKRRVLRLLDSRDHLRLGISRGWLLAAIGAVLLGLVAIPFAANWKDDAEAGQAEKTPPAAAEAPAAVETSPVEQVKVSFRESPWPQVLKWYGTVMNQPIEMKVVPDGTFTYQSTRPLNQREIALLINRELVRRGYCLVERNGSLTVDTADVIARQYAETLRKEFMYGHELRKGPDAFDAYFEVIECRAVGETRPPAPEGPAIAYVLKARRDYTAQELTAFLTACFGTPSFPSLKTGQPIIADGFAVLHDGRWLGASGPALKADERIEVWQNRFQDWNARPPADYRVVIRGLVVNADGRPIPTARVRQLLLEDGSDFEGGADFAGFLNWAFGGELIIDDQGKFLVSLRHGTQYVRKVYLFAVAPGYAPQRIGPIAVGFEKPAVPLKIELKPGFAGRMRLVLPDGKALDKGEVEVAAQDDLWTPGIPMAKLSINEEPIRVENCPAGPLLLKVRVRGYDEQEVRGVRLTAGEVIEVKVPLVRKEKRYFRGQEALNRIEKVKPAWSETHQDVQFGVALVGDKRQFRAGERVPLEMFVRNVGKEGVEISLAAEFLGNVPEVKNAAGEAVAVERILLAGTVPLYREFLKPGEAFGFRHLGVGLGPNPVPGEQNWHPYWAEPKPGKYTLRHTHEIDVDPANGLIPGKRVKFTSGVVEFEVVDGAASDRRSSRDDANRTLQAALLDRQEYLEGTFPNEERLIKSEVFVAEQKLTTAQASLDHAKRLAAKGLITAIQLQAAGAAVKQAQLQLDLAQGKLDVLRRFTKGKLLRELDRKVVDALDALLDKRVALKVTDKPLIFVLDELEKAHGVPVTIDLKEVHARGLSAQTKVTIDVADKPLREVFKAALVSAGLDFEITGKGILVPARAKAPPAADAEKPAGAAQIRVKYDIPGAEEDAQIFVQHIGGRDIIGTRDDGQLKTNPVKNGQTLVLKNLDPGDYQVARHRLSFLDGMGMSRFLDRQRFKLAAGETKTIDFTRPTGQPVSGTVLGLKEAGLKTAVVNVCSADAKLDRPLSYLSTTVFDSRLCAADGTFTTERLAPGRYKIIVEGYVVTPERLRISGEILPSYLAVATVTVPKTGEPPKVEVKLKEAGAKGTAKDPAGASLEIRYDIPGAEERGRFVVEGPNGSVGPEVVGSLKVNYVKNGQTLKLDELPPGKYQVTRYRTLMLENAFGASRFLDRRQFELQGGESKTLEVMRPGGKRVSGKILGLQDTGINKVLVNVCVDGAENLQSLSQLETTLFDALLAKDDGSFTTEPLIPGKYTIVAEGYLPLTPQQRVRTGDIEPRYVGVAKFTVPETGEAPPVEVKLADTEAQEDGAAKPAQAWGDLTVQFVYDGLKPELKKLLVPRDIGTFGTEALDESLLVGDMGELANVAVYLTSAGIPIHPEVRRRADKPAELKVTGAGTRPRILPVMVSQNLKLINGTTVGLNFKWDGPANSPFSVLVVREETRELTLNKAERAPSPVFDGIHPWLIAYLLPLDHPYAGVTGTDGMAHMANLPEGEWTFRFWHEKGGYLKSAEGQREFKIKIEPGENRLKWRVSPEFTVTIQNPDPTQR